MIEQVDSKLCPWLIILIPPGWLNPVQHFRRRHRRGSTQMSFGHFALRWRWQWAVSLDRRKRKWRREEKVPDRVETGSCDWPLRRQAWSDGSEDKLGTVLDAFPALPGLPIFAFWNNFCPDGLRTLFSFYMTKCFVLFCHFQDRHV